MKLASSSLLAMSLAAAAGCGSSGAGLADARGGDPIDASVADASPVDAVPANVAHIQIQAGPEPFRLWSEAPDGTVTEHANTSTDLEIPIVAGSTVSLLGGTSGKATITSVSGVMPGDDLLLGEVFETGGTALIDLAPPADFSDSLLSLWVPCSNSYVDFGGADNNPVRIFESCTNDSVVDTVLGVAVDPSGEFVAETFLNTPLADGSHYVMPNWQAPRLTKVTVTKIPLGYVASVRMRSRINGVLLFDGVSKAITDNSPIALPTSGFGNGELVIQLDAMVGPPLEFRVPSESEEIDVSLLELIPTKMKPELDIANRQVARVFFGDGVVPQSTTVTLRYERPLASSVVAWSIIGDSSSVAAIPQLPADLAADGYEPSMSAETFMTGLRSSTATSYDDIRVDAARMHFTKSRQAGGTLSLSRR